MSEATLRENLDKMHRWTFGTEGEFGKGVARELVQQVSDALARQGAVSLPDRDKAAFEAAVAAERQRQIEKGYTPAHDDEKGAKHLINWACDYIVKGEPVKAVALLVATLQHLERLSPAPLTINRDALRVVVGGILWNAANYPRKVQPYLLGTDTAPLAGKVVNAVLAALSPASVPEIPDSSRWSLAQVAGMIRRNCTLSSEAYQRGGDALIYAVADWVENPPEWVLAAQPTRPLAALSTRPAVLTTVDALDDLRESIEQELELGGDASTLVPAVTEWLERTRSEAALSTQPAAGEVEWQSEDGDVTADADLAKRWADEGSSLWRRTVGHWIEVQPEPQPTELSDLFPGTLAALDNLNIRPEADRG